MAAVTAMRRGGKPRLKWLRSIDSVKETGIVSHQLIHERTVACGFVRVGPLVDPWLPVDWVLHDFTDLGSDAGLVSA
jgi:hypothetical protein